MHRRLFTLAVVVLAFSVGARAQNGQIPARDAKVAKAATAVIRGRVTAADTGAPLRRARLMLSASALQRPLYSASDAQGRYEFTELPAGRYTLQASKTTFVTLQYGQRRAFEAGKPIQVGDGVTLEKIDIALPRGCVISGTVVDDLGEPVALARVSALRSRFEEGKRRLVAVGRDVETNDRGEYRIFGLEPGTYFVGTRPTPGPSLDGYPFAPSYYPGTLNPADAQRVVARLGQERGGIDFVQPPGRLARVSGMVIDSGGHALTAASVSIVSPSSGYALGTPVKADGSFTLQNIAPGEYLLAAMLRGPGAGDIEQTGMPMTVTGEDVAGLVLQMTHGCRLQGRVLMDDGAAPPFSSSGMRVDPLPIASDLPITIRNVGTQGIVKDDWTFDMTGIGGTMLFRISKLPAAYMLKSVLLDGRDITDQPLDIKGTDDVTGLEVVLTRQVTEITGVPVGANGHPILEYAVVVFADDAARWKHPSRYLATARPDQQGRFKIVNLPPGRYLAVALEYLEDGQWEDPDYLDSLRPLATGFTLSAGETKTLNLKVTAPGS